MANNRMFLVCEQCRVAELLAKSLPAWGQTYPVGAFLEAHSFCGPVIRLGFESGSPEAVSLGEFDVGGPGRWELFDRGTAYNGP